MTLAVIIRLNVLFAIEDWLNNERKVSIFYSKLIWTQSNPYENLWNFTYIRLAGSNERALERINK